MRIRHAAACLGVIVVTALPAAAQAPPAPASVPLSSNYTLGALSVTGAVPFGFRLSAEVPLQSQKRWEYIGPIGPDGIAPVVLIGLFEAPPPSTGITFTLQQFANTTVVSSIRDTYSNWLGQWTAPPNGTLRLEWTGDLKRATDTVPIRGFVIVGSLPGGFYRFDGIETAALAGVTLPVIERAFAGFTAGTMMTAAPVAPAPVAPAPAAPPPAAVAAPTREQRWDICVESTDFAAKVAACTFLSTSAEETVGNRAIAFYNRANAYAERDDHARAIADFDESIRLDPSKDAYFYYRGISYQEVNQHDLAIRDFTQAIRMAPSANRYYARGFSYFQKDENISALLDFDAVLKLNPDDLDAIYMIGAINYEMGNDARALAQFDDVLRRNPRYVLGLLYRAATYYRSGDRTRPLQDLNALLAVEPTHARALYFRGLVKRRNGDVAGANADMAAGLKLSPNVVAELDERGIR